jgi:hypothetical protein
MTNLDDAQQVLDARFQRLLRQERGRRRPPVTSWDPPDRGAIDIHIDRDGTWFHEGERIRRAGLVRLFSGILRREAPDRYYLVTPVEKYRIRVDDVPFLGVDFQAQGSGARRQLIVTTNVDDHVLLDEAHPLVMRPGPGGTEPRPYVLVRDGLEARLTRSMYYRLVELADIAPAADGAAPTELEASISSAGARFPLGRFAA